MAPAIGNHMDFAIGERRPVKFERFGETSMAPAIGERRPLKFERFGEISMASVIRLSFRT